MLQVDQLYLKLVPLKTHCACHYMVKERCVLAEDLELGQHVKIQQVLPRDGLRQFLSFGPSQLCRFFQCPSIWLWVTNQIIEGLFYQWCLTVKLPEALKKDWNFQCKVALVGFNDLRTFQDFSLFQQIWLRIIRSFFLKASLTFVCRSRKDGH